MLGVREVNWICQHLFEHQYAWHVHRPIIVMRAGLLNHLINPTSGGLPGAAIQRLPVGGVWGGTPLHHGLPSFNTRREHNLP